jgi:photosystem II stability/assembly factor-like uncharacterized protein
MKHYLRLLFLSLAIPAQAHEGHINLPAFGAELPSKVTPAGGKISFAQRQTGRDRMEYLHSRDEWGLVDPQGQARADQQRQTLLDNSKETAKLAGIDRTTWETLGPGNISGRVRAVLPHPSNPQILWAASTRGGIWKTTDGGANWRATSDNVVPNTISSIILHPSNPDILYAGTGEGFRQSRRGAGILTSTDGGNSWKKLGNETTFTGTAWYYVNRLLILPQDPNVLMAATREGIYRSSNAGASFSLVKAGEFADLKLDPNNNQRLIAGEFGGKVALSTNAGLTWSSVVVDATTTFSTTSSKNSGRIELAYSAASNGEIFASVDANEGDIYRSLDAGQTWTLRSNPKHLKTQGGYGNAIWVHPKLPNLLLIGGINAYRSFDGGLSFSSFNAATNTRGSNGFGQTTHADHHGFFPATGIGSSNQMVYNANDGGIWVNFDVTTPYAPNVQVNLWRNLNNGLNVSQGYGVAASAKRKFLLVGTQDTGLIGFRPNLDSFNGWQEYAFGGDYFSPHIDDSSNYSYATVYYLLLHRLSGDAEGNMSSTTLCHNLPDAPNVNGSCSSSASNEKANFDAPIKLDPNDPNRLYAGGASLWVSTNPRANGTAVQWREIKPALTGAANADNYLSAITVNPANSNQMAIGYNNGEAFITANALAATPQWIQLSGIPARLVENFLYDARGNNQLYVMIGGFTAGNLLRVDLSNPQATPVVVGAGQLPDINVFNLSQHPLKPNWFYAGTAAGFYVSQDDGKTWNTSNDGPSAASITSQAWYDNNTLMVSTFGRGVWQAKVNTTPSQITVYEVYNNMINHYFRTSNLAEVNYLLTLNQGWSRTFDDFKAWSLNQDAEGTAPVCRFYGYPSGPNSHVYLVGLANCNSFRKQEDALPKGKGWNFESYEYTVNLPLAPTANGCPSFAPVAIHRVYNNGYLPPTRNDAHHRYTTQASEIARLKAAGWTDEGVVACGL